MPARSSAPGTCSHSSSAVPNWRAASAWAPAARDATPALTAAVSAAGRSCAAYQWWASSAAAMLSDAPASAGSAASASAKAPVEARALAGQ